MPKPAELIGARASDYPELANPVWQSLTEAHRALALDYGPARFYPPDYCAFGALADPDTGAARLAAYAALTAADFYIVGHRPALPASLRLRQELVCWQMLRDRPARPDDSPYDSPDDSPGSLATVMALGPEHATDLFGLVRLALPGFFQHKTHLLGQYFGVFHAGQLVAATGVRMQMRTFAEISGVATHPDFTRRGYAQQLVAHTADYLVGQGQLPYLHVAQTNVGAIALYEKLGFVKTRAMSFWQLTTQPA